MGTLQSVRPSPIAGRWYPADPAELAQRVDGYLREAEIPKLDGEVLAIMAPHAGHIYSGSVAGYAFGAVRGVSADLVAVISPMHYPYPYPLMTSLHRAYATPLGEIPVDHEARQELDRAIQMRIDMELTSVAQDPEHSLEIELPFLQRVLDGPFKLLPVMVREQSVRIAQGLGNALADVLRDRRALLVASTDLSHFYPLKTAEKLDANLLEQVENFDPKGVIQVEEQGKGFACGRGALAAVMWAAKELGADKAQVLHYATSGAVTGDTSEVVGYGAAVFLKS